jgi:ABC-type multidrug transport system fused ATPase/permease subunit
LTLRSLKTGDKRKRSRGCWHTPRQRRGWTGPRPLCQARAAEIAVVKLENIGKRYQGGPPILSDISLKLEAGGFYFLTGASGAG